MTRKNTQFQAEDES